MKDVFGVFLIFDQLAKVMQCLQRAKTRFWALWVNMLRFRAACVKLVFHFHAQHLHVTNINVNIEIAFLHSLCSDKLIASKMPRL